MTALNSSGALNSFVLCSRKQLLQVPDPKRSLAGLCPSMQHGQTTRQNQRPAPRRTHHDLLGRSQGPS